MFCNKCGAHIPENSVFCSVCGHTENTAATSASKKTRSLFGLILGIVCLVLIFACSFILTFSFMNIERSAKLDDKLGFSSPEKAAEEYIRVIFSGDGEDAVDVIHPDCVSLLDGLTVEKLIERVEDIEDDYDEEYGEGWYVRINSAKIIMELPKEDFEKNFENIKSVKVSEAYIVECSATLVYPDGEEDTASLYVTAYRIDGRWHAVADYI